MDESVRYNRVYTKGVDTTMEIQPEYVYLTIPAEYVCIYHKLVVAMADFGKTMLDDCTATCKDSGKNVINCWNLFQSAVAAHTSGRDKEAKLFIDYIEKQLSTIYQDSNKVIYNGGNYYPITPDGRLKALCSCAGLNTKFTVDLETGQLYQEYLEGATNNGEVFTIEDENLVVTNQSKI
jgi:hypothetical protein